MAECHEPSSTDASVLSTCAMRCDKPCPERNGSTIACCWRRNARRFVQAACLAHDEQVPQRVGRRTREKPAAPQQPGRPAQDNAAHPDHRRHGDRRKHESPHEVAHGGEAAEESGREEPSRGGAAGRARRFELAPQGREDPCRGRYRDVGLRAKRIREGGVEGERAACDSRQPHRRHSLEERIHRHEHAEREGRVHEAHAFHRRSENRIQRQPQPELLRAVIERHQDRCAVPQQRIAEEDPDDRSRRIRIEHPVDEVVRVDGIGVDAGQADVASGDKAVHGHDGKQCTPVLPRGNAALRSSAFALPSARLRIWATRGRRACSCAVQGSRAPRPSSPRPLRHRSPAHPARATGRGTGRSCPHTPARWRRCGPPQALRGIRRGSSGGRSTPAPRAPARPRRRRGCACSGASSRSYARAARR